MKANSLGEEWFRLFYPRISEALNYQITRDEESRDVLSRLLTNKGNQSLEFVQRTINRKRVVMFGAGPSLESDLAGLDDFVRNKSPTIIAADGAADALYKAGISPSIIVSDLDSCSIGSLKRNSREGCVFAHSHGDNMPLVEKVIPELANVLGTTQVSSVENVTNFGGLTDGDRACFIASYFLPSSIIIAGMDFGSSEGTYSKSKYSTKIDPRRPTKLSLGRESLEFLIGSRPEIRFLNVTKFGEEIRGAPKIEYAAIT